MVGLNIITDESSNADVLMDVVHFLQIGSLREGNFSNIHNFETIFSGGFDSDREMGLWDFCVVEEGPQYFG